MILWLFRPGNCLHVWRDFRVGEWGPSGALVQRALRVCTLCKAWEWLP